jgi:hypothetical protein
MRWACEEAATRIVSNALGAPSLWLSNAAVAVCGVASSEHLNFSARHATMRNFSAPNTSYWQMLALSREASLNLWAPNL